MGMMVEARAAHRGSHTGGEGTTGQSYHPIAENCSSAGSELSRARAASYWSEYYRNVVFNQTEVPGVRALAALGGLALHSSRSAVDRTSMLRSMGS